MSLMYAICQHATISEYKQLLNCKVIYIYDIQCSTLDHCVKLLLLLLLLVHEDIVDHANEKWYVVTQMTGLIG